MKNISCIIKLFFYSFFTFLWVSCKDNPKPIAQTPKADLKKTKLEGAIKTQNFITYALVTDSISRKTIKMKKEEFSIIFNKYGFELEEFYRNDSLEKHSFFDYDANFRRITENYITLDKKKFSTERILNHILYDSLGYEVERNSYFYQDTTITAKKYNFSYDDKGQKTAQVEYIFNENYWKPTSKLNYEYNEQGKEIEKRTSEYYLFLWITKEKETHTYTDNLLKKSYFSNAKDSISVKEIIYNYKGREQIATYINKEEEILYTTSYLYDNRGNILKTIQYNPENIEKETNFYIYTPQNKLLEMITYQEGKETQRIFYEYNTKGNITKENVYKNGKLTRITEVKYTYYDTQ
ncbi:MAG: sugar-binding protein [Capnocytophaga sp.]|nr:sugar-binding protein [Capnocytophaga sp.]